MAETYRAFIAGLAPVRWLSGATASRWWTGIGLLADAIADIGEAALASRAPRYAPDDALPLLGDNRQLARGPNEPVHLYRARLATPFAAWSQADSDAGILHALGSLGFNAHIRHNADWNADGHPGYVDPYWARFWIILDPPSTRGLGPPRRAGDGAVSGDGSLAGVTGVSASLIEALFSQVHQWKGSHAALVSVLAPLEGALLCGDGHHAGAGLLAGLGALVTLEG
jgi:hypothetical protein